MPPKLEEKNDKPVEKPELHYYWSKARDFHLANFIPEKKSDLGMIIQDEISLVFTEHVLTTANPDKIAHIENSNAFRAKRIVKCEDAKELIVRTATHNNIRSGVVEVKNEMERDVYSASATG